MVASSRTSPSSPHGARIAHWVSLSSLEGISCVAGSLAKFPTSFLKGATYGDRCKAYIRWADCGGGVSETEVKKIVDEAVVTVQVDYRAEIKRGDNANIEAVKRMLLEDRALRQEYDADNLKDLEGLLEETKEAIQSGTANALRQHVYATCVSDYKTVALSVALGTMLDYLAGGESTLEEVTQVLTEGVPIDDRDFYAQQSRVCGITTEGKWHLQPIPAQ